MTQYVIFWILFGLAGFAFALAVQMRYLIGVVLRRVLMARTPELDAGTANTAISWAASDQPLPGDAREILRDQVAHLKAECAKPLAHFRIAKRWCIIGPILILILVVFGRMRLGLF